jgi:hypothetical protein
VDGLTIRVNRRGKVVWCNSWSGLLLLALMGHAAIRLDENGTVIWCDRSGYEDCPAPDSEG